MCHLCTMTLDDLNVSGVPRYPVGISQLLILPQASTSIAKVEDLIPGMSYPFFKKFVVMGYLHIQGKQLLDDLNVW